jgi:sucrose-6-phosphatase
MASTLRPPKFLSGFSIMSTPLALFVTDLDNTLVGDPAALQELNEWLSKSRLNSGTKIVYATGRSRTSYQSLAASVNLLPPDGLISSVGTEIYLEGEEPWSEWENHISPGWQRSAIPKIAAQFADLKPQPIEEQRPYKISYYLSETAAIEVIPRLRQELRYQQIPAEIIYSGNKDLDIIPKASNKGAAVQFLQQYWQLDTSPAVVCGDSGNDISLFNYEQPYGIFVGNAQQELKLWYELNATERHYLAHGNYARGILEGLEYFRFG